MTVTKKLKLYDIPLKKVTRRETGSMVYGYRKRHGKSVEVKTEQAVIEIINGYRETGYSYQRIADFLNQKKINTKKDSKIWYSKVVRQIYKRGLPPV